MHAAAFEFVESVKDRYPEYFAGCNVVEFGSLNVNGTIRVLFSGGTYIGVDLGPGDCVDVASVAHRYQHAGPPPDVVISMEMLEHDMFWFQSLPAMLKLLRPGGLLILTAGGIGREEHGTTARCPLTSPFTSRIPVWQDYYGNIGPGEIEYGLQPFLNFSSFEVRAEGEDIYFWGLKNIADGQRAAEQARLKVAG